jgi:hypothetical protein
MDIRALRANKTGGAVIGPVETKKSADSCIQLCLPDPELAMTTDYTA